MQSLNDERAVFNALRKHAGGVRQLWEWLKREWESLFDGPVGIMTGMVIGSCVGGFSTWGQLKEVEAFFKAKDTKVNDILLHVR